MDKVKCPYCDREFDSYDSMRRHASRHHKINSQQCYVDYYLNGEWPTCKCGCGQKVKWDAKEKKFRDFVQGHQSRVTNNWGHNKKAIEKSAETRRKQFASGERKVWNDGLNTKTDKRVSENGKRVSEAILSDPKQRKDRSDKMKQQWKTKNIVPLTGSQHSQWKGGSSSIQQIARGSKRLYTEWKLPILQRDNFTCQISGKTSKTDNLHVHHDDITFSEIIQIAFLQNKKLVELAETDYEARKQLADKVIDYHVQNDVSGVTVCEEVHKDIHPSFNF